MLAPEDGEPVMAHMPGQYIGLHVMVDGAPARRQYSLSAASNGSTYRISVKRETSGQVSRFPHERVAAGDVVELFAPAGVFVLCEGTRPLVLISGGVGITPTLPMLDAALAAGRAVHFIHAARNSAVHAFRSHVDALADQHPQLRRFYCYGEPDVAAPVADASGYLNTALLAQWMPASRDVDVYFLGPLPFMQSVKRSLQELGGAGTADALRVFRAGQRAAIAAALVLDFLRRGMKPPHRMRRHRLGQQVRQRGRIEHGQAGGCRIDRDVFQTARAVQAARHAVRIEARSHVEI